MRKQYHPLLFIPKNIYAYLESSISELNTIEGIKMISWNNLVTCVQKLEELPNGGGSEIEFTYQGVEYSIVSYRGSCELEKIPDSYFDGNAMVYSEDVCYTYRDLTELGKATDFGFSVEQCWPEFETVCIRPDFDYFTLEEIYASYESAYKSKKTDC